MRIHACKRLFLSQLWACEVCRFTGSLQEAIAHCVANQYRVAR